MLDQLTKASFQENLHTTFAVACSPQQSIDLELIEVREGRTSPRQEQFAPLFRGPVATPLSQGMWSLNHAALGQFDLFMTPVGADQDGYYYEAVFNRLLPVAG
jgi:hypothetical protein